MINLVDSLLILIVFLIKDIPLIVKIYRYDLSQGLGYFGRNYNDKSPAYRQLLLGVKVACNDRLLYNFIYALVVGLIFWNKLFASVLLLDVLAHIPSLSIFKLIQTRFCYRFGDQSSTYCLLQWPMLSSNIFLAYYCIFRLKNRLWATAVLLVIVLVLSSSLPLRQFMDLLVIYFNNSIKPEI